MRAVKEASEIAKLFKCPSGTRNNPAARPSNSRLSNIQATSRLASPGAYADLESLQQGLLALCGNQASSFAKVFTFRETSTSIFYGEPRRGIKHFFSLSQQLAQEMVIRFRNGGARSSCSLGFPSHQLQTMMFCVVAGTQHVTRGRARGSCNKMSLTVVEFASYLLSKLPTLKPYPCRPLMWIQPA